MNLIYSGPSGTTVTLQVYKPFCHHKGDSFSYYARKSIEMVVHVRIKFWTVWNLISSGTQHVEHVQGPSTWSTFRPKSLLLSRVLAHYYQAVVTENQDICTILYLQESMFKNIVALKLLIFDNFAKLPEDIFWALSWGQWPGHVPTTWG